MKINYTMYGTSLTGGVRVLLEIANGLVERGHDVTLTTLGNEKDHAWFPLKAEVNYVSIPTFIRAFRYGTVKYLKEDRLNSSPMFEIKSLANATPDNVDINVATLCFTAYSAFCNGSGIPFYHMQHYEPLFFDDAFLSKIAESTYYLPLNKIANSIWLKNLMREKLGVDLPVVNPAVDHEFFFPRDIEKDTEKLRVVAFGKQTRWKGFPELLEAMKTVMSKVKNVEFIVYGGSRPDYPSSVPYTFLQSPSDEQLADLYSSADVVVTSSWYESFPLPPIEAMACGAPVVTTQYGTEDYAFDEQNALVVPPRDPLSLANAIERLLEEDNLREQFKREGPKTAKLFTWNKTVDQVEKIFKSSLKVD